MTGSTTHTHRNGPRRLSAFSREEIMRMTGAIDAVCEELGVEKSDSERREAIAGRVMSTYAKGRRHPLYLVHAGLGA